MLTDRDYWKRYYGKHSQTTDLKTSIAGVGKGFDAWWEKMSTIRPNPETVCEIGCYPGRYLAYVCAKYKSRAFGLDFNDDIDTVVRHLHAVDAEIDEIVCADFLEFQPEKKHDWLISIGFIEHFDDPGSILDKHTDFLASGGVMLVTVPNMRGVITPYKRIVDRENLLAHNLEAMRKEVFERYAERAGIELLELTWSGGFPSNVHQALNLPQKVIHHVCRRVAKVLEPSLKKRPSRWYSSELIALFRG